jgi:hypothetical protein
MLKYIYLSFFNLILWRSPEDIQEKIDVVYFALLKPEGDSMAGF